MINKFSPDKKHISTCTLSASVKQFLAPAQIFRSQNIIDIHLCKNLLKHALQKEIPVCKLKYSGLILFRRTSKLWKVLCHQVLYTYYRHRPLESSLVFSDHDNIALLRKRFYCFIVWSMLYNVFGHSQTIRSLVAFRCKIYHRIVELETFALSLQFVELRLCDQLSFQYST